MARCMSFGSPELDLPPTPGSSANSGSKSRDEILGSVDDLSSSGSYANWTSMARCASFVSPELGLPPAPGSSANSGSKSRDLSFGLSEPGATSRSGSWPNWTSMPSPNVKGTRVLTRM